MYKIVYVLKTTHIHQELEKIGETIKRGLLELEDDSGNILHIIREMVNELIFHIF